MANEKNLKPHIIKSAKKAREMGKVGGIKSGIAKRKKKLLTEIYKEFIQKNGKTIDEAILKAIKRGDNSSISALREIRQATEGDKIKVDAEVQPLQIQVNIVKPEDKP